ncbi:MAG: hypothetical protein NUV78_02830 [Candidatus Zambryskibacteria bacterium]|nr:hypothetical protein [Candidatus Zambryskibacteria bacterium]
MEHNQFVEFVAAVVRCLPRDMDSTTAQGWITNQKSLTKVLREGLTPPPSYEVYYTPTQEVKAFVRGSRHLLLKHLLEYLRDSGFLGRCLSLDDEVVKEWTTHPATYPTELKNKLVFLWGSTAYLYNISSVACLYWSDEEQAVRMERRYLDGLLPGDSLTVLSPQV